MVDKETLFQLIKHGAQGNQGGVQLIGRRIAEKLKQSEPDFSSKLMSIIDTQALRQNSSMPMMPVDADSRQQLLIEYYPVKLDHSPVWNESLTRQLKQVVYERKNAERLLEKSLTPIHSMLFEGPPGVGKTLAAKWLASQLDLPLLVLDLTTVMSSFLGKTGNNIRAALNYATETPCILLLDEFDSIAKRRDDDLDVGELKRLVTVLLQAIDDWPSSSFLIAATNHGELLDPAVWRRFDLIIHFEYPNTSDIERFLTSRGIQKDVQVFFLNNITQTSYSDLERRIHHLKKISFLENKSMIDVLLDSSDTDVSISERTKRDREILSLHHKGISQREIHRMTGISRPTIRKIIHEHSGELNYGDKESSPSKW